jgi:hypothetical protein
MIISNSFNLLIMRKWWNAIWVELWRNWCNVIVFRLHIGLNINTANLWRNMHVVMDAVWSVTKSMTKLTQRHSVWTSYRASYPALPIYDEIWVFVMDVVWSVMKSENVMGISSWIKRFLVVSPPACGTQSDTASCTERRRFINEQEETTAQHALTKSTFSYSQNCERSTPFRIVCAAGRRR